MQNHAFIKKNGQSGQITANSAKTSPAAAPFAWLFLVAAAFALALVCLGCAAPQKAYAKSYEMPKTTINATVQPNGDLHVVEQRQFDFDGVFSAVWWNFNSLPYGSDIKINSVGMGSSSSSLKKLSSVPFQLDWRDEGGPSGDAYSFDQPKNTVYVFFSAIDESDVIQLDYTVTKAAQAYSDVGELYWQFVGSGWAEDSSNVSMTLNLPVASGAAITPGENVRAWGHGPLNASVNINADGTVSYEVPSVKAGSYAEARVVFPVEWLTGVTSNSDNMHESTARLDTVLSEEQTWADRANADRATSLGVLIATILVCLALLILGIRSFVRYGKELEPAFKDEYWRDVPVSGAHPAEIGRLWRFDKESSNDLTATIMHLANAGAVLINRGSYEQKSLLRTKQVSDYYLTRVPEVELTLNSEIDRKAMSFLFDTVAQGQPSLWLGSIKAYAEKNPEAFNDAMADWQGIVTAHVIAAEYFEGYSKSKRMRMLSVAVILLVACFIVAAAFDNLLVLIPGVITGVALLVVSRFMERRTQKGADAYARCKALRKWLTEFSSLDERPTTDVKVWGEFMVYAYLFGVAKEAIAELRKKVPEMFQVDNAAMGSAYVPWWAWYTPYYYADVNMPDFGSMLETSVTESVQAVQSALSGSSSDGFGGGGGFSVGGGGGFGGGGGAR